VAHVCNSKESSRSPYHSKSFDQTKKSIQRFLKTKGYVTIGRVVGGPDPYGQILDELRKVNKFEG